MAAWRLAKNPVRDQQHDRSFAAYHRGWPPCDTSQLAGQETRRLSASRSSDTMAAHPQLFPATEHLTGERYPSNDVAMRRIVDLPEGRSRLSAAAGRRSAFPGPRQCIEPWRLSSRRSQGRRLNFAAIRPSAAPGASEKKILSNSCSDFGRTGSKRQ